MYASAPLFGSFPIMERGVLFLVISFSYKSKRHSGICFQTSLVLLPLLPFFKIIIRIFLSGRALLIFTHEPDCKGLAC